MTDTGTKTRSERRKERGSRLLRGFYVAAFIMVLLAANAVTYAQYAPFAAVDPDATLVICIDPMGEPIWNGMNLSLLMREAAERGMDIPFLTTTEGQFAYEELDESLEQACLREYGRAKYVVSTMITTVGDFEAVAVMMTMVSLSVAALFGTAAWLLTRAAAIVAVERPARPAARKERTKDDEAV